MVYRPKIEGERLSPHKGKKVVPGRKRDEYRQGQGNHSYCTMRTLERLSIGSTVQRLALYFKDDDACKTDKRPSNFKRCGKLSTRS
jgi:hypothetical protein